MKLKTWQIAILIGLVSYVICILAQAIPNFITRTPILLFPTDIYQQIELVGFISGVIGVYLTIKESAWNYPVGLVWASAYAWYFYSVARHLGEAAVMIITAGYLIDGWIKWAKKSSQGLSDLPNSTNSTLEIQPTTLPSGEGLREGQSSSGPNQDREFTTLPHGEGLREGLLQITHLKRHHWIVIGITLAIVIPILIKLLIEFRGNYVYFDAITTALGLTAQYLTNRKVFQSWYFWIAANIVIIPVFIIREYYPTAILYVIFSAMAFIGIKQWRASLHSPQTA